jgi:hypothetical protein
MTPSPLPTRRQLRVLLITLVLALASTMGLSPTAGAADVLIPRSDTGGAGGDTPSGAATSYDDLLAGSGYETAAITPTNDPSGEVATTDTSIADSAVDETDRALALHDMTDGTTTALTQNELSIQLNESLYAKGGALAGGDNDEQVLTQAQQSIRLVESLYAEGGVLAGGAEPTAINGRGQLAHRLTEHAQAEHAQSTTELASQATGHQQTPS